MRVAGQIFAKKVTCRSCGHTQDVHLQLTGRLRRSDRHCAACGGEMRATGFDLIEWLNPAELCGSTLERSLRSFGIRSGDVVTLRTAEGERHFEIRTDAAEGVKRKA